jgi:hypothetical protein
MKLAIVVACIIVIQMGICGCILHIVRTVAELSSAVHILADISDAQFETDQKQRERLEKVESDVGHLAESSGQRLGNLENKVTLLERSVRNG